MSDPFLTFPYLMTPRLRLREIRADDADDLVKVFKEDAVTRYYDIHTFSDRERAHQLIRFFNERWISRQGMRWAITRRGDDVLLGTCGFNSWDRGNYLSSIGYELGLPHWGQGIMTEALRAVLDYGFANMALNRVEAEVVPGNLASERVLQKLGFQREGLLREKGFWGGAFHDLTLFALLKADYSQ